MFIKAIPPKLLHDKFGLYKGQWMSEMDKCWIDYDRGYSVCSRLIRTKFGNVEHVTITRVHSEEFDITFNGEGDISWNEKMSIKNELFGENRFAIEVYPKQDRLVDICDVYHLWVFDKKLSMPFGIHPKEYTSSINRGYSLTEEELVTLQEEMKKKNGVVDENVFRL